MPSDEIEKLISFLESNRKKHLMFDFDETICHLILPWGWYLEELHKLINKTDPDPVSEIGTDIALLENTAVKKHGNAMKRDIVEFAIRFESEKLERIDSNPDMIAFLIQHADQYTYSIWSSNTKGSIEHAMKEVGLDAGLFSNILAKDTLTYIKQDPEGFDTVFDS